MKKRILKYIILFILILIFQIFLPLDLDEIWNYGFSHNIATGLIPYKDFNMVITPFFSFFCSIFLIIKSNILIIHIIQSILIVFTYYLLEKIYDKKAIIFILLLFLLWNCIYPSYNSLLVILTIILIYLEKTKKNDHLVGIILGLIILTKQSVGISILICSLLCFRKYKEKIIKRSLAALIPIIIFILYLLVTNSYYEFIDLCILGLFDFGKNNRLDFNITYILFIISFIAIIYLIKKNPNNYNYWYSLGFLSISVPMFDIAHFRYFIIIFITLVILPKLNLKKINIELITFCSMFIIVLFIFMQCYFEEEQFYYPNKITHFEYKYISKSHKKELLKISNLCDKYKDYNIIFLSRSSYLYKLVNDKRINYFDLINRGNWGYNGSIKLYDKLKKERNSIFIVQTTSFTKNDQTDTKVLDFIKRYCNKINQVDDFEIYIRK